MERPQPGQIGHTCIRVQDIDKTVAFYGEFLGMPIAERRSNEAGTTMVALGSQHNYLEVFPVRAGAEVEHSAPAALRLNHFCLWVEDLEGIERRAAAAGNPLLNPIGRNANWVGAAIKVGWILDPDGNRVELLEWTGPAQA